MNFFNSTSFFYHSFIFLFTYLFYFSIFIFNIYFFIMSDTLNNNFLITLSHFTRDLGKSQIHQNLNKIKKEIDEKYIEENRKKNEKKDNILQLYNQNKLTDSFNIEKNKPILNDLNLSYLIDNIKESKNKNVIRFNHSLNQIRNNELDKSNLIIEAQIENNDTISDKKNENEMIVEIFYSPHSFIENSFGKDNLKKKKSFFEKEMNRQKYIKNKLKKLRHTEQLKELNDIKNKPLINTHSTELIHNEEYIPIFNRAKKIFDLKNNKILIEQKIIEKQAIDLPNRRKKFLNHSEFNNFIKFQNDWKVKTDFEKKVKEIFKSIKSKNKLIKKTKTINYSNKKSNDLMNNKLFKKNQKFTENFENNIFQKLYDDYDKKKYYIKKLEKKYSQNFSPFILNYIKPKNIKSKTLNISLDISMDYYEKKKLKKNYLVKTSTNKKKNTSVSNLNEVIKINPTMNNIQKKLSLENNLKKIVNQKPIIFITPKKPSEISNNSINKIDLKTSYEKNVQPSLNGEKSSSHIYHISSSNISSNEKKSSDKKIETLNYFTPILITNSQNIQKKDNKISSSSNSKEISSYININYDFDNSENHFCDDMNFSSYNKSYNNLNQNDKPSWVNKLKTINYEKEKKIKLEYNNQINKLYMINTGISSSNSIKPNIIYNKKCPFNKLFEK